MTGTAAWVARTDSSSIGLGLDPKEALVRAHHLIAHLRDGEVSPAGLHLDDAVLDVFHAAVEVVASASAVDASGALEDASRLHHFISAVDSAEPSFSEKAELLQACSLWAWRLARRAGKPRVAEGWARQVAVEERSLPEIIHNFRADPQGTDPQATPISEREEKASELYLDEPEVLISLCELLTKQLETSPATVCEEAEFFYRFVSIPQRPIGLFDEREYFLGELALIAGTACRVLFRREQARRWFDLAETNVVLVANGTAHVARLAYQKLALAVEERRFDEVLKLAPVWSENFLQLGMPEDALKCRFLVGIALWESGRLRDSVDLFLGICNEAEAIRSERLIAQAANNLAQLYATLGEAEEALTCSRKALPLQKQLGDRVGLAKLQWGMGDLLRGQGNVVGALEAYRSALREAGEVGMRGDVAALHLVLADVLLGAGQDRQAEWEIRAALPIIEEEKMVPEGYAALSLLQESLRRRQIDRNALRNLHGYFRDPK